MADKPKEDSPEVKRAQYEIDLVGLSDKDSDYGGMIGDAVMQLIRLFSAQGHSGFSASMTGSIFYRLVQGKALTPVTSDPNEWLEVTKEMYPQEKIVRGDRIWQNKRQYSIFSKDGGKTWEDMEDHSKGTSISREEALDGINERETEGQAVAKPEGKSSQARPNNSTRAEEQPAAEPKDSASASNEEESRDVEGSKPAVAKPELTNSSEVRDRSKSPKGARAQGSKTKEKN